MDDAVKKVVDIATGEIGYFEKASRNYLDDKTANAGTANITKYARDMDEVHWFNTNKQGAAWCAVFVTWCFYKAFGMIAKKMLFQPDTDNCAAGCSSARGYYNKNKRLYDTPEPGDQIFFWSSDLSKISHTGLVVNVNEGRVYTIEGNTSDGTSVVANGGAVCFKNYSLSYDRIAGYGRPDWALVEYQEPAPPDSNAPIENTPPVTVDHAAVVYAKNGKPVNLRVSMSTSSRVICQVPVGQLVQVSEEHEKWSRVTYKADTSGYMMNQYLIEPDQVPNADTVTMDRKKLLEILACLNDSLTIVQAALEKGVGNVG